MTFHVQLSKQKQIFANAQLRTVDADKWNFKITWITSKRIFKMANQVRQNFHEECEEAINRQINMELFASYTYLSMVSHSIFNFYDAIY